MGDTILTINAGSSSAKLALFQIDSTVVNPAALIRVDVSDIGGASELHVRPRYDDTRTKALQMPDGDAYKHAFEAALFEIENFSGDTRIVGAGHRIVHGGTDFAKPIRLSEKEINALKTLEPLAPRHQPHNLRGVECVARQWPNLPQVGCFDTAFHRTQSNTAEAYALPKELGDGELIRFGFHGLSYEYVANKAVEIVGEAASKRMIIAHLGAGASMCAVQSGKSIATTMGFTALDGLPMGTRCGSIDPGVLLYMLEQKGMSPAEVADCLYNQSGLLGLSGVSADMRTLEMSDDPNAKAAIDYFVYRAIQEIGSLTAVLGGLDALIFTGGIGENSANIRRQIVEGSAWLGFALDNGANSSGEACITLSEKHPSAWVIPTDEEYMIARHTLEVIAQA